MRVSGNWTGILVGCSLVTVACSGSTVSPTGPGAALLVQGQLSAPARASQQSATTHGQPLTAVLGSGSGTVNVTPTAAVDGTFSAQITVTVHDAPPNTTFFVQRAPEIGRPNSADGICQRAVGAPPWGSPVPNFLTFPLPASGPLVTLETSPGGAGTVHIDFDAPTITDGTLFDVMFRLVDSLTSPTNELRSDCFTVTVK